MADLKNLTFPSDSHKEWTQVLARAIQLTSVYYGLFLVVMGCACNPLSFIVMSRKSFRSSNLSLYLRILSALDLGNLLTMFFNVFMLRAFGIDFTSNLVGCHIRRFFGQSFLFLSSWILVIVTAERVVCIHKPHRYRTLCSKVVAKAVLATTVVIVCLISLLFTLTSPTYKDVVVDTMTNTTTVLGCQVQIADLKFNLGQIILTVILFAFLPGLLLIVFNILIIVGVARSRKSVMEMSNITGTTGTMTAIQRRTSPERNHITRRNASLTKIVLAINITFILCNFPACAFGATLYFMADLGPIGLALNDIFLMLIYTNNAMNFVLYCVTGSKFRSEVKAFFNDIIHCRCSV